MAKSKETLLEGRKAPQGGKWPETARPPAPGIAAQVQRDGPEPRLELARPVEVEGAKAGAISFRRCWQVNTKASAAASVSRSTDLAVCSNSGANRSTNAVQASSSPARTRATRSRSRVGGERHARMLARQGQHHKGHVGIADCGFGLVAAGASCTRGRCTRRVGIRGRIRRQRVGAGGYGSRRGVHANLAPAPVHCRLSRRRGAIHGICQSAWARRKATDVKPESRRVSRIPRRALAPSARTKLAKGSARRKGCSKHIHPVASAWIQGHVCRRGLRLVGRLSPV